MRVLHAFILDITGAAVSTTQGTTVITGTTDWTSYTMKPDNVNSDIMEILVYLMLLSSTTG